MIFSTIDWGGDNYYLQVELDLEAGRNFILIGATQFVSVPYALRAKSADIVNSFAGSEKITENTVELESLKAENAKLKQEMKTLKEKMNAILEKLEE
ncbi:MAG: hypothetical protein HRT68_11420 [Flavobacteriaceae bacterium]|nr:hypothetical protein [Flavobacteriaceae bacterium]